MKTSSELLLLDVNVMLALAWPNHQFHRAAVGALSSRKRWATCALTQLGFIRLSSNPAAVIAAKNPNEASALLARLVADPLHVYLEQMPPPVSAAWGGAFALLVGHRQVTDAYLLKLAAANDAVLLTFDRRMEFVAPGTASVRVLG